MAYFLSGVVGVALTALAMGPGQAEPATCETGGVVTLDPVMATHTHPPYPPISQRLGEYGVTQLEVNIGANGLVTDAWVRRSSSSERLDHAALDYVKANWKWAPVENCHAVTTRIAIDWVLLRPPAGPQSEAVERPLPPLPSAFDSLTPQQQSTILAQRFLAEMHFGDKLRQTAETAWAPVHEKLKTSLAQLPEAQRSMVLAAFDTALDEAHTVSTNKLLTRFTQYYASHVSRDDLRDVVALYALPEAQKSVSHPEEMTLQDRQAMGRFVLAHPGAMRATIASIPTALNQLSHSKQDRAAFVADFHSRFCAKLDALEFKAAFCRPVATPPDVRQQPIPISVPANTQSAQTVSSEAKPQPPVSQLPGCADSERKLAQWAHANGYHYGGSCN
jgi:TonB family protein